jgi:hypothetical protein
VAASFQLPDRGQYSVPPKADAATEVDGGYEPPAAEVVYVALAAAKQLGELRLGQDQR